MTITETSVQARPSERAAGTPEYHEHVVIGAGVCGIYGLHKLAEAGEDVVLLERHEDLGGTWFKNRYPGCRFDSESYTYGYSFSDELLQEWNWSERFAAQPETLSYLNHVAEKFDLRRHMRFGCSVTEARFNEETGTWEISLADGRLYSCRFLLTALGLLSAPVPPRIPGREDFEGLSLHTYDWPTEPLDLHDKRVAVIGTGSTGVQIISSLAGKVKELDVFQMNPNWCAPLNNSPISSTEMKQIKSNYDSIFAQCAQTPGGFIHGPDRRRFADVPPRERRAFWEKLYAEPGFGIWLGNFRETMMDEEANAEMSEFVADKIRERVDNPAVAEKLIPKDHGFGVHRVPMETNYYEAYNHDSVHLIDLKQSPIEKITATGIQTSERHYDLDLIVYATGFDAITGSYDRINFIGRNGQTLRDKWDGGPTTYLGVQVDGFPNLIMLGGPHSASVATNFPRAIEVSVDWASDLLSAMREQGKTVVEPTGEAEADWTDHIRDLYQRQLLRKAKSWFTGYNPNIEGHDRTRYLIYAGGANRYREHLARVAADGYPGLSMTR